MGKRKESRKRGEAMSVFMEVEEEILEEGI